MTEVEETCNHGKKIWANYGDGKVRHLSSDGIPLMQICTNYNVKVKKD